MNGGRAIGQSSGSEEGEWIWSVRWNSINWLLPPRNRIKKPRPTKSRRLCPGWASPSWILNPPPTILRASIPRIMISRLRGEGGSRGVAVKMKVDGAHSSQTKASKLLVISGRQSTRSREVCSSTLLREIKWKLMRFPATSSTNSLKYPRTPSHRTSPAHRTKTILRHFLTNQCSRRGSRRMAWKLIKSLIRLLIRRKKRIKRALLRIGIVVIDKLRETILSPNLGLETKEAFILKEKSKMFSKNPASLGVLWMKMRGRCLSLRKY